MLDFCSESFDIVIVLLGARSYCGNLAKYDLLLIFHSFPSFHSSHSSHSIHLLPFLSFAFVSRPPLLTYALTNSSAAAVIMILRGHARRLRKSEYAVLNELAPVAVFTAPTLFTGFTSLAGLTSFPCFICITRFAQAFAADLRPRPASADPEGESAC